MDERLKSALDFANYRVSLFNQKEHIKLKMDSMLTYGINGGIFKASIELITFVNMIISLEKESVVLIDINGNPIEITDLESFKNELLSRYFEATNLYNLEYLKLRKARSIKDQFSDLFKDE